MSRQYPPRPTPAYNGGDGNQLREMFQAINEKLGSEVVTNIHKITNTRRNHPYRASGRQLRTAFEQINAHVGADLVNLNNIQNITDGGQLVKAFGLIKYALNPPEITMDPGWTQTGERSYEYEGGTDLYPSLNFAGIKAGKEYRIVGNITEFTGSIPKITVRLGAHPSPDWFNILSTGTFDRTGIAHDDTDLLSLIVNSRDSTTRVTLEDFYLLGGITDGPIDPVINMMLTPADRGGGNAGFNFGGIIDPKTLGDHLIYQVASFGENFVRVDLGEDRKQLLSRPPQILFPEFSGKYIQLIEQLPAYSYGNTYPGLAAYLTSMIGTSIPVQFIL